MARELSTKVRNAIRRQVPSAEPHLRNVVVNGSRRGCTGYVVDPATGNAVWLDTDVVPLGRDRYVYRSAPGVGAPASQHGTNKWAASFDEFIAGICDLLKTGKTQHGLDL